MYHPAMGGAYVDHAEPVHEVYAAFCVLQVLLLLLLLLLCCCCFWCVFVVCGILCLLRRFTCVCVCESRVYVAAFN
jgi:hypothetical protein